MNEGMEELLRWLEQHKERLSSYSLNEISDVAIACGFRRSDVAQWVTKEKYKGRPA